MTVTAERATAALEAITGNGWVAGGLGGGEGMGALGASIRPADALAPSGQGWLTEHVKPLQDIVDRMAGNASVIQTFADTWQRAAEGLNQTLPGTTPLSRGISGSRCRRERRWISSTPSSTASDTRPTRRSPCTSTTRPDS